MQLSPAPVRCLHILGATIGYHVGGKTFLSVNKERAPIFGYAEDFSPTDPVTNQNFTFYVIDLVEVDEKSQKKKSTSTSPRLISCKLRLTRTVLGKCLEASYFVKVVITIIQQHIIRLRSL